MRPVPIVASTPLTLSSATIPIERLIGLLALSRSFGRRQCACRVLGRELIPVSYSTCTRWRLRVSDRIANREAPFGPHPDTALRVVGAAPVSLVPPNPRGQRILQRSCKCHCQIHTRCARSAVEGRILARFTQGAHLRARSAADSHAVCIWRGHAPVSSSVVWWCESGSRRWSEH